MKVLRKHDVPRKLIGADEPNHVDVCSLLRIPKPKLGMTHALPLKLGDAQELPDPM